MGDESIADTGDWKRYYEYCEMGECATPLRNKWIYKEALDRFADKVLKKEKVNILIGGVVNANSAHGFSLMWEEIRSKNNDNLFFIDKNGQPLKSLGEQFDKVQGRLEDLPVMPGSVDVVVLDFTLDFLSPESLSKFLDCMSSVLSPEGRGIALISDPLFPGLSNLARKIKFGVPHFQRRLGDYKKLIGEKFCILFSGVPESEGIGKVPGGVLVFAKQKEKID